MSLNKLWWLLYSANSHYEKFADGTVKCIDDEIPFEIPQSWCWVRLGNICSYLHRGKSPQYGEHKVLPIIAQKCNQWDMIYTDRCLFSSTESIKKYKEEQFLQIGDVIINSTGGGTVGRTGYIDSYVFEHYSRYVADSHVTVVRPMPLIVQKYIYYFLISPQIQTGLEDRCSGSTNQIELGTSTIYNYLIPVPPIKEQRRIVEKIQDVLPWVNNYGKTQIALDKLNTNIFDKLRKSVLQEAIQGRLVPQSSDEEPASVLLERIREEKAKLFKEGKLKKKDLVDSVIFKGEDNKYYEKIGSEVSCIEDDIPFEIPSSWEWVRLEQLCTYIQRGKSPKYSELKKYPVVAQKCNQWSGFSLDKALFLDPATLGSYGEERFLQDGDLLWNSTGLGTLGRMAIYDSSKNEYGLAVADSHVTVIRAIPSMVSSEYLFKYFSSHTVQSVIEDKSEGSTKQKELATSTVKSYIVPLPPYEEQLRIVAAANNVIASITRR